MKPEFIRERITALRLQKGVSEYQMSYDLGHSRGYINNISSGKTLPSMSEFLSICDYFSITPSEFFNDAVGSPALVKSLSGDIAKLKADDLLLLKLFVDRMKEDPPR